jgi:hypothetical protein
MLFAVASSTRPTGFDWPRFWQTGGSRPGKSAYLALMADVDPVWLESWLRREIARLRRSSANGLLTDGTKQDQPR